MAKTSNLYARIEPDVKEQAEAILSALGIPASSAVNMFYKQIILHRGLPFDVVLPADKPLCMGAMTEQELNSELEKGYDDMQSGAVYPAADVFDELRKDHSV